MSTRPRSSVFNVRTLAAGCSLAAPRKDVFLHPKFASSVSITLDTIEKRSPSVLSTLPVRHIYNLYAVIVFDIRTTLWTIHNYMIVF